MSKHTKEPWVIDADLDYYTKGYHIMDEDGHAVAGTWDRTGDDDYDVEDEANAVRIVACVNACAGMEDPSAEIEALRKERRAATLRIASLVATITEIRRIAAAAPRDSAILAMCDEALAELETTNDRSRAE